MIKNNLNNKQQIANNLNSKYQITNNKNDFNIISSITLVA
jgi:hypothetical protein